ncbi:type II toxin-antitoxin system RelE/ParE family toxin [Alteromonas portus]|uniref:type II toxin-antitoxin system RelE/ParE family toxin n=1 Tax=Alteromonas portus TaxID=2565549 RepID=UPI003BF811AF
MESIRIYKLKWFKRWASKEGFSKSTRSNISGKEMKSLKLLAKELLNYSEEKLKKAIDSGSIEEVR